MRRSGYAEKQGSKRRWPNEKRRKKKRKGRIKKREGRREEEKKKKKERKKERKRKKIAKELRLTKSSKNHDAKVPNLSRLRNLDAGRS